MKNYLLFSVVLVVSNFNVLGQGVLTEQGILNDFHNNNNQSYSGESVQSLCSKLNNNANQLLINPNNDQLYNDFKKTIVNLGNVCQQAASSQQCKDADNCLRNTLPIAQKIDKLREQPNSNSVPTGQNNSTNNAVEQSQQKANQKAQEDKQRLANSKVETEQMKNNLEDAVDKLKEILSEIKPQNFTPTNEQIAVKENILGTNKTNNDEDFDKIANEKDNPNDSLLSRDSNKASKKDSVSNVKMDTLFFHKCVVHITNNTNKNILATGGLNFTPFTNFNRIPCSILDENGKDDFLHDCMSTMFIFDCGNGLVVGKGGFTYEGTFWNDKSLINENPTFTFHTEIIIPHDNLKFNITDTSSTAHLELGPDKVQANTPLQIETHGVLPLQNILFNAQGIVFSFSIEVIETKRIRAK